MKSLLEPRNLQNMHSLLWFVLEVSFHWCTFVDAANYMQIAFAVTGGQRPDEKELQVPDIDPVCKPDNGIVPLMHKCWSQEPTKRPEFTGICICMFRTT